MLSYRTIEPNTLELLNKLSQLSILSDMRLVGGTSLALQYGHRKSGGPHGQVHLNRNFRLLINESTNLSL